MRGSVPRRSSGFTFIELCIVMSIIGILAIPMMKIMTLPQASFTTQKGILKATSSHSQFRNFLSSDLRLAKGIESSDESSQSALDIETHQGHIEYRTSPTGVERIEGSMVRRFPGLKVDFEIDSSGYWVAVRVKNTLVVETYRNDISQSRLDLFCTNIGANRED
ncbi:MAG: prepilin-type N-terminal cleavage/methylation domain-containing protein [Candidatus Omnitrophica bacterium]|nr:prepilin-type N-terminal cleavage/methylation domain-containing protein [Candidatus Omnitrophota bacterium]MCB9784981.1 prepilin-type N-terminal cleavage/methylation domain-containing protein [Candidatus Omnitrophota bacterium]